MYDIKDTTTSFTEVISLVTLKNYLRVPTANTTDDTDLTALIETGRRKFEQVTWRSILPHDYELIIETDEEVIDLPFGPIDSVSAIYYWDTEEWVELDSSDDYYVHGNYNKRVELNIYSGYKLKIVFTTLGDDASEYLNLIKEWIAAVYYNRPDSEEAQEKVIKRMLNYRINVCR